jgi:protein-tyrosine phosphatase
MQRAVTFSQVHNFRDLGGYLTADGRSVRWHRLFRADDLSRIAGDDQDRFCALGIRTVVDLRRPHEIEQIGRIPEIDGCTYHHVHLMHPKWPDATFTDTPARAAFVTERYLEMSEEAADGIGAALRIIADDANAPVVIHCIAGKDRTGVVSALTLSLLGVADDEIAADYELSEAAEEANWRWIAGDNPQRLARRWDHITVSPREGMLDFLTALRRRHTSIEGYAASVGVTDKHLESLRAHLLTPLDRSGLPGDEQT